VACYDQAMFGIFLYTAYASLILFVITFLLAIVIRNNSIVDVAWGLGFIVIALVAYLFSSNNHIAQLVLIYTVVWGVRLAYHIIVRNWGKGEDFRYAKWRKEWGKSWITRSFFQVFLLQWGLMQLISIPVVLGIVGVMTIGPLIKEIGMLLWLTGFFFEAVGDYQLSLFKKKKSNQGKLMTTGLWSWTRHPNYFGEALLWWGIAVLAYGVSGKPYVFIGPIIIDFLLLFVSGIPMLEKKYHGRADWRAYAKKTSAFFPMPPRN
jgi:steroid 5-alpha reductase family enzyme